MPSKNKDLPLVIVSDKFKFWRIVIILTGVIGLGLVVFGSVLPVLWPLDGASHLISLSTDSVLIQLMLIFGGAILQASFVGWLYDRYSQLKQDQEESFQKLLKQEGFVHVFPADRDPEFENFLVKIIRDANSHILFAGLGMGYLNANVSLIDAVKVAVKNNPKLEVDILYGDPSNAGLQTRLNEEFIYAESVGLEYDVNWPERFFNHVATHLPHGLTDMEKKRVKINRLDFMPMIQLIKVDNTLMFAMYGSPNQRGRNSPWSVIHISDKNQESNIYRFFSEFMAYAKKHILASAKPS